MPTARMTKLEAVNMMLRSIGETNVAALGTGLLDSDQAEDALDEVSREVQAQGWNANTRWGVELSLDGNDQFLVGATWLKVDTTNYQGSSRTTTTRSLSEHVRVAVRESSISAGTYCLYDIDNDTDIWTNSGVTTLTVNIVEFLDFADLPYYLQIYIAKAAAHRFQKTSMLSSVLREFTFEEVLEAKALAQQSDLEEDDMNVFRDSPHAYNVAYRYNPWFGR